MQLIHTPTQTTLLTHLRRCDTFLSRLRGLMFRRALTPGEGLLFIYPRDSILDSSIHMFFMAFPIAAVWLNSEQVVVDAQLAHPWRPYYAARQPARYIIEAAPDLLDRISIGDTLTWLD